MLSYNSGVSKTTRVTPFYAMFGIGPNVHLWTTDFSTGEVKSDKVSDQLHNIRKAQNQAYRIIVQNKQHERAQRQHVPSAEPDFQIFDRVWVKLFDKHSQNPKLDPTFEPGIIIEQKSSSTFNVNRS